MKRVLTAFGKTWIPAVAALVLLLLLTSPASFGEAADLSVARCDLSGNVVTAVVANSGEASRSGTLTIGAVVDGKAVLTSARVSVMGKSTSTFSFGFPSHVDDVIVLGIKDDYTPF